MAISIATFTTITAIATIKFNAANQHCISGQDT
jgi:hypothetical protein